MMQELLLDFMRRLLNECMDRFQQFFVGLDAESTIVENSLPQEFVIGQTDARLTDNQ